MSHAQAQPWPTFRRRRTLWCWNISYLLTRRCLRRRCRPIVVKSTGCLWSATCWTWRVPSTIASVRGPCVLMQPELRAAAFESTRPIHAARKSYSLPSTQQLSQTLSHSTSSLRRSVTTKHDIIIIATTYKVAHNNKPLQWLCFCR